MGTADQPLDDKKSNNSRSDSVSRQPLETESSLPALVVTEVEFLSDSSKIANAYKIMNNLDCERSEASTTLGTHTLQKECLSEVYGDSSGTLVNKSSDQSQNRQRIQFRELVTEADNLVQSMLDQKKNAATATSKYSYLNRNEEEDSKECHKSVSVEESIANSTLTTNAGGSVISNLMRLQFQRKYLKKKKSKKNKNMRASMPEVWNQLGKTREKKGILSRPSSWLPSLATDDIVPTLQKRKSTTVADISRRTSIDSTCSTASQFEPLNSSERLNITFNIAHILQRKEFLRKLVKALMLYGAPAHRLENIMREVSSILCVDAEYIYLPNVMFLTFFDQCTHTTETHFIRCIQLFDMQKLGEIFRIEKLLAHGEITLERALLYIIEVEEQAPLYPTWTNPLIYAIASFCGSIMFYGGDFKEGGLSAILAIFFALYELISGRFVSFHPIWDITICIFIGFASRAVGIYGFCFTPVAFASFIIILPGYSMTISIIELVSRQLVSGVVRMVYAIVYSFLLGYGIEMGSQLLNTIDHNSVSKQGMNKACQEANLANTCHPTVSKWFYFLTVPLFAVTYCIFLRASYKRWGIMISVASLGFLTTHVLACYVHAPSRVLQVLPAFVVGLTGNIISKTTGQMALDAMILGILYMVPGSLGLKAALGFFVRNGQGEFANQGAVFALGMIETAIGISIGLFVATLIVYPKGTQHTPLMNF